MSSLCASKSKRILKIRYLLKRPFITSKIPRIFSALIFVKSILCAPVHSFCKPPQHFNEVVTTVCKQLAHEKQRISFRVNSWKKLSYFCSFLFQIGTLCWQGKASQTCVLHIAGVNKQTACFHTNYLLMKDRTLYTGQDIKETLEKKLWTLERHLLSANGQMQQRSPIGGEPRKSSWEHPSPPCPTCSLLLPTKNSRGVHDWNTFQHLTRVGLQRPLLFYS